MADRRMFAKKIIDSDAFLSMPLSTQALYFHLSMRADDDGFVSKPRSIQRLVNATDDDMKILISKRYILIFDTGIIVIKHWKIHNYIRGDRKTSTIYEDEKNMLVEKDNGSYTEADGIKNVPIQTEKNIMTDICQSNDSQVTTKCPHRLGKVSIGKYKDTYCGEEIGDGETVINYLNEKLHSKFSLNTAETKKLLSGRFHDGYTVEDMEHVIDLKCDQWINDAKLSKYLRPSTLFRPSNFESYVNEYNRSHAESQKVNTPDPVASKFTGPQVVIPEDC